jgi:hypothetical protein
VGLVADDFSPDEVDLLQIGAVVATGFEAVEGELRGDVLGGEFASAGSGAAAFEQIVGEELDVSADIFGIDGRFRRLDGRRNVLRENGSGEREKRKDGDAKCFQRWAPARGDESSLAVARALPRFFDEGADSGSGSWIG